MYTYLIVLLVSFLIITYLLKLLSKPFFTLAESSVAVVNSLLSKVEEELKVKLVQRNANKLLLSFSLTLLTIAISFALGFLVLYFYANIKGVAFSSLDFSSVWAIIALSVGSTIGFIIPVRKKNKSGYSDLSKLLHRMALDNYNIAYKLFKREYKSAKNKKLIPNNTFVIVSGLARSGTTSLMYKLNEQDVFVSLSYASMPFLTCPNLWRKIYKPKSEKKTERSHKDGVLVGLDSSEALEEYFFKVLANDAYIYEDYLSEYNISKEDYNDYLNYQTIIKQNNHKLYLAKNNNFILRYKSIRDYNKDFLMVLTYREPLTHAASLLQMHKQYAAMQNEDDFILEYMNWLGHHEFGNNQKPFRLGNLNTNYIYKKDELDYWLQIWINYYSYILTIDKHNVVFVNYNEFCQEPNKVLGKVYTKLNLQVNIKDSKPFINNRKIDLEYTEALKLKADKIFNQLKTL